MTWGYVLALLILTILIMADTLSECTITCKCGKKFENTIFGACILFDYHHIKEHILNKNNNESK